MVFTKNKKIENLLLFSYLLVFPFGQLFRISILNASDFIVALTFLYVLGTTKNFSKIFKIFTPFILVAGSSLIFSIFIFKISLTGTGFLYFLRLVIYWYFLQFCFNFAHNRQKIKELLFSSLMILTVAVAVFGWFQYFVYPDLTALKYLGWDDHLFRLVGTFLDPGFTGLIIVLGVIITYFKKNWWLFFFLILSLAFTYSRAGYLALIFSLLAIAVITKKFKLVILSTLFFLVVTLFLPKSGGQGVNLARTYSISARFENYRETLTIFNQSPVFGIGFNNFCLARQFYLHKTDLSSHSCSGSDSSLLLILATTGMVGFLVFISCLLNLYQLPARGLYFKVLIISGVALLAHSLFVNSLFYPWLMGYFVILLSIQDFKEKS